VGEFSASPLLRFSPSFTSSLFLPVSPCPPSLFATGYLCTTSPHLSVDTRIPRAVSPALILLPIHKETSFSLDPNQSTSLNRSRLSFAVVCPEVSLECGGPAPLCLHRPVARTCQVTKRCRATALQSMQVFCTRSVQLLKE